MRANPVADPLTLAMIPWLMATGAVTMLPHFNFLPTWLAFSACLAMTWRYWLWKRARIAVNSWLIGGLACAGAVGVFFEYRTIFGREPGVALLVVLMSLKLMEMRQSRDAIVVVMLAYFLLLTHYFFADSIPVGLWMLVALWIATATLIRLQSPVRCPPKDTLQTAGLLILQALPIMAVLFLLFPRIDGPLWGVPQDSRKARSGLSEEMAPGSISDLSLSSALAFRAEFKERLPARDVLYWRGPVLSQFDGRTWKPVRAARESPLPMVSPRSRQEGHAENSNARGQTYSYSLTLEPHQQFWLLALDLPVKIPADSYLTSTFTVLAKNRVRDRLRVDFTSLTSYLAGLEESPAVLKQTLALPPSFNPRSTALAESWRKSAAQPDFVIEQALRLFREENFVYTLKPPLTASRDGIDEFLFASKRGFCEHYASSFVFLMRAAGIPARIVAGYLGGEMNPIDGHLSVRQSDAHAWAEVWISGEGWRRVDPTAAVAPNRIEQGLQASLPEDEALPVMLRPELDWLRAARYRWDAIDYAWNRWILGYGAERQQKFLQGWGMGSDWQSLVGYLAISMGLLLLLFGVWTARRPRNNDRIHALWLMACDAFAKHGFERAPGEGPLAYSTRIISHDPDLGKRAHAIADHYVALRYASTDTPQTRQRAEYIAFCRTVGTIVPQWKMLRIRFC